MPAVNPSAMSHKSGSSSGQEISPTLSLPLSDMTVMFRPAPWKIGPSGYIACTWPPRKYSGICGPGTLDTTKLCTGRDSVSRVRAYTRIATPNTAGPANWLQSCRSVAPMAELCSLATVLPSAIAISRWPTSSISVCRLENIPETWLRPGRSERSWTDTGTMATSVDSGSSPRSIRNLRSTPDTSAITTSLTFTPKWSLTVLTSSRSSWLNATLRCAVTLPLKGVWGAANGLAIARPPATRRTVSNTVDTVDGRTLVARLIGRLAKRPRPPSAIRSGLTSALASTGSGAGALGSTLHSWDIRLAPVTPSTAA